MEQRTTHTLIKKSTCANKKGKDMEKLLKQKKKILPHCMKCSQ